MKAGNLKLKKLALALIPFVALVAPTPAVPTRGAVADEQETAATYKAKCAMCHGAKADKKFDAAKPDAEHVEAITKGREGAVKMPAYAGKVSEEQAQALVTYMKSLRQ
ncbi:MAG TPA: cytochrome c [Pyrinomonadaceae bacterium]|nr:cytochrome c [Pyrinomonadaceae bacterium]